AGNGRSTNMQMIDSTHVKAHRSATGGKGEQKQAVGRSRGGRNRNIHALADVKGPGKAYGTSASSISAHCSYCCRSPYRIWHGKGGNQCIASATFDRRIRRR